LPKLEDFGLLMKRKKLKVIVEKQAILYGIDILEQERLKFNLKALNSRLVSDMKKKDEKRDEQLQTFITGLREKEALEHTDGGSHE